MEAHQEEIAARRISVRGEYHIEAQSVNGKEMIVGSADYVLGYDPPNTPDPKYFESTSVIVEAKRYPDTDGGGLPQVIAYMAGVQQQRMRLEKPKRIVDTTYGILSDGINWRFYRLSGKKFQESGPFNTLRPADCISIYRFVDTIIKASVALSPHTTPQRSFPATQERWEHGVESQIFGRPHRSLPEFLQTPTKAFLDDDETSDLEGVEEFEIIRPKPSEVKVGGALLYLVFFALTFIANSNSTRTFCEVLEEHNGS